MSPYRLTAADVVFYEPTGMRSRRRPMVIRRHRSDGTPVISFLQVSRHRNGDLWHVKGHATFADVEMHQIVAAWLADPEHRIAVQQILAGGSRAEAA